MGTNEGVSGTGRVVVGVDGSAGSLAALRWAFAHSDRNGPPLVALNVWKRPSVLGVSATGSALPAVPVDRDRVGAAARRMLQRAVTEALGECADQVVLRTVEGDGGGRALAEFCTGSTMLVVGAHRRHGFGLSLGSTASRCIRFAHCPVVVVPAECG